MLLCGHQASKCHEKLQLHHEKLESRIEKLGNVVKSCSSPELQLQWCCGVVVLWPPVTGDRMVC